MKNEAAHPPVRPPAEVRASAPKKSKLHVVEAEVARRVGEVTQWLRGNGEKG